jgi:predicted glycosyltransferase
VLGVDPAEISDREALRAELGYGAAEKICIVTVGGSSVGAALLRRILLAAPIVRQRIPGLRLVVVAGPRIDPATLPHGSGVEIHGYIDGLYRHLAACDIALVQGGLTTCMELVAARVPFLYFPLRHHFEQNVHVRHRLERYAAGRCMDYASADPDAIATAMVDELTRRVVYRPVESDGDRHAARQLAELL